MGIEENKTLIYSFWEELNKGNLEIVDEYFDGKFIRYSADGQEMDKVGYKNLVTNLLSYFPDIHYTVDDIVAEEDKVAFRFTWTATSQSDAPDGSIKKDQKLKVTEDYFCRLDKGKIVEFNNLIGR